MVARYPGFDRPHPTIVPVIAFAPNNASRTALGDPVVSAHSDFDGACLPNLSESTAVSRTAVKDRYQASACSAPYAFGHGPAERSRRASASAHPCSHHDGGSTGVGCAVSQPSHPAGGPHGSSRRFGDFPLSLMIVLCNFSGAHQRSANRLVVKHSRFGMAVALTPAE